MPETRTVELFFDVGSSYSYLAVSQVDGLRERSGARVRLRPFLLGAVFKETGNEMPARVPAKARWMLEDLRMWSERYGIPFRLNSRFPLSTLTAQRALVAAEQAFGEEAMERFAKALMHAMWAEDRDVSSGDEIAACANEAGLDAGKLAPMLSDAAVKDALREQTAEAVLRGAFGAPTFFVGERMYWGHDRMPLLEAHLTAL